MTLTRPLLLLIAGLSIVAVRPVVITGQGPRCETAKELVKGVRANLPAEPSRAQLVEAQQTLLRATQLCPGLGDAYYFLSLVGTHLKDERSEIWRNRAKEHGSKSLQDGDPLAATAVTEPAAERPAPTSTKPAAPVVHVSQYVGKRLALVVGVSRFQDPRINSLKYTARDAESIGAALKECCEFDYVKTLLDEDATRKNLANEIDQLAKTAEPSDLVVVYVSSHGSPENLDTAGVNYIVTYDTEVTNLYSTAYGMDDLLKALRDRIKSERVVAFLDTCYSGGTYRELPSGWTTSSRSLAPATGVSESRLVEGLSGSRSLVVDAGVAVNSVRKAQGVGRVIVTSSKEAERSWEDDSIKHGYFTYFLLDALKRPGPLSVDDVFDHLRVRVPEAVQRDKKESQHPMIVRSRPRVELYLKDRIVKVPDRPRP